MTPVSYHQLRWLRKLERVGEARRDRSNVGYSCMRRGWTEWVSPWSSRDWNERLTEDGRDILRQYRHVRLRDMKGAPK